MSKNEGILYGNMRSMISLIDKLRDFHLQDYISLPRIAVLGEQSAGKSSLLETIAGLNFLPRGTGIVTRRPLELRMIRSNVEKPYFLFPKEKGEQEFSDPEAIKNVIEELTDKVAGSEKGISNDPITCTVFSATVPDLTLIDLPGITKNPVKGQPQNIEQIIKDMVKHYCSSPDTLILCVIPANIDLANSDALKFANELDPHGERTIGVLTKIDLMDEGMDAKDILLNNVIKLKYGYVGIKGRSQGDVNRKMTVDQAVRQEMDYFGKHPIYSTLPSELMGTRSLVDRVSTLLYKLIEKSLPRIKKEIKARKKIAKESLDRLGTSFPETEEKKLELVFKLVREFKDIYTQGINGSYHHNRNQGPVGKNEETMIYQLNQLFGELHEEFSDKNYKVSSTYTDQQISHAIRTYQNVSIPGFHSFDSFLYLMHPKIDLLKEPIIHLLDECKSILESKGIQIIDHIFKKFHQLHHEVKETFLKELNSRKQAVKKILENFISGEDNYLFTNDPTFLEQMSIDKKQDLQTGDLLTMELRQKIDKYFFIIVRNIRDVIPKLIGQFLVKKFNKSIEMVILNSLNRQNYCLDSLQENKSVANQRKQLLKELNSLQKAESLLINDFNMGFNYELEIEVSQKSTKNKEIHFDEEEDEDMEEYLNQLEQMNEQFLDFNQKLLEDKDKPQVSQSLDKRPNPQLYQPRNQIRHQQSNVRINQSIQQPQRPIREVSKNRQDQRYTQQPQQRTNNFQQPPQTINFNNIPQQQQQQVNRQQQQPQQQTTTNNRDPFDFNFLPNDQRQRPQQQNNQQQQQQNNQQRPQQRQTRKPPRVNNLFGE